MPLHPSAEQIRIYTAYLLAVLALALVLRTSVVRPGLVENDEVVYTSLVENLEAGKGYTLQGHPLLERPDVPKAMYGGKVFFHPPVGIFYFWGMGKVFSLPLRGEEIAQLLAFAAFFLAAVAAAWRLGFLEDRAAAFLLPVLAAFTPIVANSDTKIWIDNPRLAFFALAFLSGVFLAEKRSWIWIMLTAIFSLATTLTKIDSVEALGLLFFFLWFRRFDRRVGIVLGLVFALNVIAAVAWAYYSGAARYAHPSADAVAMNAYLRDMTTAMPLYRFPADYLRVTATLLPSVTVLALGAFARKRRETLGLLLWVGVSLCFFLALAAAGYPKVVRYLILSVPACLLLFARAVEEARAWPHKPARWGAVALLFAGFSYEIYQGAYLLLLAPDSATAALFH